MPLVRFVRPHPANTNMPGDVTRVDDETYRNLARAGIVVAVDDTPAPPPAVALPGQPAAGEPAGDDGGDTDDPRKKLAARLKRPTGVTQEPPATVNT